MGARSAQRREGRGPAGETLRIRSTWTAYDTVRIPEGMTLEQARAEVPSLPDWLGEQIAANDADLDLTDWEVEGR